MIFRRGECIVGNAKHQRYKPTVRKTILGLDSKKMYKVVDKKKWTSIIARCH